MATAVLRTLQPVSDHADAARLNDLDDLAWLSSSNEHSEMAACCIQLSERKQSLKLVVCNGNGVD